MKPVVVAVLLGCAAVGVVGYMNFAGTDRAVVTGSVAASRVALDTDPRTAMNVVKVDWRREGFGLTATADVSVRNNNSYVVRVDRISCRFRNKDGSLEEHAQGVYDIIHPRTERTIRNVSLGFVSNDSKGVDCSVAGARKEF
ncbi:hypothetical protein [Pseudorhodoplanes sp.]|uniref:hypothetical protein n=1 Tax=Pseudorhodoplanes sp. TaxID=1934341 RepID=UPI002B6905CD|nr:hypothetical protein [Pseudorhodoplanes sp.]HWV50990.1 hypothetical protein [Pseudorhodoplanes sp.]